MTRPPQPLTAIWDINPRPAIRRNLRLTVPVNRHGFCSSRRLRTYHVDYPGAAATIAFGIRSDGAIVGQYTAGGHTAGFESQVPTTTTETEGRLSAILDIAKSMRAVSAFTRRVLTP